MTSASAAVAVVSSGCTSAHQGPQSPALERVPEVGTLPDEELAEMLGLTSFRGGSDSLPDAASFIERLNKDLEMEHGIATAPGSSHHTSEYNDAGCSCLGSRGGEGGGRDTYSTPDTRVVRQIQGGIHPIHEWFVQIHL